MTETATLQSLNPLLLETFEAQVIDVSEQGISLQLTKHIATQSEVKIRRGTAILFGEVRYCVPAGDGFRAGVRIKETVRPPAQ